MSKTPPPEVQLYEGTLSQVVAQLIDEYRQTRAMVEEIRDCVKLDKEALIRETEARVLAEAEGDVAVLRRKVRGESNGNQGKAGRGVPLPR